MTPKEKAKELTDKYYNVGDQEFDYSKEFALIAVDEILESHYKVLLGLDTSIYNYWQEVKKEITKL